MFACLASLFFLASSFQDFEVLAYSHKFTGARLRIYEYTARNCTFVSVPAATSDDLLEVYPCLVWCHILQHQTSKQVQKDGYLHSTARFILRMINAGCVEPVLIVVLSKIEIGGVTSTHKIGSKMKKKEKF